VIKTFGNSETAVVFSGEYARRLPSDIQRRAKIKLLLIDVVGRLEDLMVPPSNRLEALRGDRRGQYSIRINDKWRVCFTWNDGDAYEVEIVDYHR
jgi:toxin HigB-1